MPKIRKSTETAVKGSEPSPSDLPYVTSPRPYMNRESDANDTNLFNLQFCVCGCDRMFHGDHVGKGKERRIILNCVKAGRCLKCARKGGTCTHFVFDVEKNGVEGKRRRETEKKKYKVVPPGSQS